MSSNEPVRKEADATLWCMHVSGCDEVHPAPDRATAQRWAAQNTVAFHCRIPNPNPFDPVVNFTVEPWPYGADSHEAGLAPSIARNTWPVDPLSQADGRREAERLRNLAKANNDLARLYGDRIRTLETAIRVARGWVITCSESRQARRDLATIDAALAEGDQEKSDG